MKSYFLAWSLEKLPCLHGKWCWADPWHQTSIGPKSSWTNFFQKFYSIHIVNIEYSKSGGSLLTKAVPLTQPKSNTNDLERYSENMWTYHRPALVTILIVTFSAIFFLKLSAVLLYMCFYGFEGTVENFTTQNFFTKQTPLVWHSYDHLM